MSEAENKKTINIVKELIEKGKQKGVLSEQEIEDALSELELDADQIEKIHDNIEDMGIDISDHMSTQISEDMVRDADLILVMTTGHKNILIDISLL